MYKRADRKRNAKHFFTKNSIHVCMMRRFSIFWSKLHQHSASRSILNDSTSESERVSKTVSADTFSSRKTPVPMPNSQNSVIVKEQQELDAEVSKSNPKPLEQSVDLEHRFIDHTYENLPSEINETNNQVDRTLTHEKHSYSCILTNRKYH